MRESPIRGDDSDRSSRGAHAAGIERDPVALGLPAWFWSVLALVLGAALSLWGAGLQQRRVAAEREAALQRLAESSHAALEERLAACELLVRALQTLFATSSEVTADEFARAYANLHPREIFPSLQAMVYSRRELRADGEHYVSELVAPEAGNERLFGLDVRAQPPNFAAAQRARDTGRPVLSGPFRLVQAPVQQGPVDGVTLRLPVYSAGPPPLDLAERRARTLGSLAVSFRVRDLIADALQQDARASLHLQVQDIAPGGVARMLYDSHPQRRLDPGGGRFQRDLRYGGRVWRVRIGSLQGPANALDWRGSVLLPGLAASLLLAGLVWSVVTTRRRALELGVRMSGRYRESEERFRLLNELLPAMVLLARTGDGRITYANQVARARLGAAVGEGDALLPELFDDAQVRASLARVDGDAAWRNVEVTMRSLNGDRFWASVSISQVHLLDASKLLVVAADISEQRQLTELLGYQATHDALTDLYNRREFERRVERALFALGKGGPPCALLYIDLDQFKLINDTSGHLAGDQLLGQLALAMAEQLRGGDILARLGGDEFGILAPDSDREGARVLAERLRTRIEGHAYVWNQRSYTVSASIGVVMLDTPGQTLQDVLAQADAACYMAKDYGRNRIHFYSEQDDETVRRRGEMEWAHRLRWVIEQERLLLDYQEIRPLRERDGGVHIELLLRLRDESGAIVPPGAFLPAAERYGLMPMLDRWVVQRTLENPDRLHAHGAKVARCSLNLSVSSIEDEVLAGEIVDWVRASDLPRGWLCLEITETEAVRSIARVMRFIERAREAGCLIALDDFGAGMASFGYLKSLPVDVIKIDGSFVRELQHDPMSRSIVNAIAEIGHQRGADVVAEWVHDLALLPILRRAGVDYVQGFALHEPEPVLFQRAAGAGGRRSAV